MVPSHVLPEEYQQQCSCDTAHTDAPTYKICIFIVIQVRIRSPHGFLEFTLQISNFQRNALTSNADLIAI